MLINRLPSSARQVLPRRFATLALCLAAAPLALAQAVKQDTTPAPKESEDETITLSPFVVDSTKDKGYYAENTLAGSRMKSNIGDLASAITVVTKQQLDDTGSTDINDVFRYEASTEGSSTYTPSVIDRNTAKDTVAGYSFGNDGTTTTNSQSNRLRGMAAPDASMNYYKTSNRIPFDSYNIQSVEVSKGPNSLLFGMGSPAGIVNQTVAQASTTSNSNTIQVRVDDRGSYRQSFSFNRALIKGKLGIYGAALYDDTQFIRKPSYDKTHRFYFATTVKPWKHTTIRVFAESFANAANRPNFVTPRDYVTNWFVTGRPAYDPVSRTVTVLDTGKVVGSGSVNPYVWNVNSPGYSATALTSGTTAYWGSGAFNTASPYYVAGMQWDTVAKPVMRVDGNNVVDWFARQPQFYRSVWTSPAATLPTGATLGWTTGSDNYAMMDRAWTSSVGPVTPTVASTTSTYYSSYNLPGVTNKSIYDWTKYNINQQNFASTHAANYNAELEQEITKDLFFSAGFLRQVIHGTTNYTIGQLQGATLYVDTNLRLPDGSTNKYFGLPFVQDGAGTGGASPDTFKLPEQNDSYRAMLSYNLDFTRHSGWTRWLGNHRLLAMYSGQANHSQIERWRQSFVSGDADGLLRYGTNTLISGSYLWSQSQLSRYYYLASPGDAQGVVTHSSGSIQNPGWNTPYSHGITVYNYNTSSFQTDQLTTQSVFVDAGSYKTEYKINSLNLGMQSNLWADRLISTLGWRRDIVQTRKTSTGILTDANGTTLASALTASQLYPNGYTDYDLVMNRWTRYLKDSGNTKTVGAAFRPLKGWHITSDDTLFSEFLSGFTIYANKSDNFNPPTSYQTDYFGKKLPTPSGEGTDIGFGFNILKNKLVARVSWYETKSHNERTTSAATLLSRLAYIDTTCMLPWAQTIVRLRHGANPAITNWNSEAVNPVMTSDSTTAEVYALMNLPVSYYSGVSPQGTQESQGRGMEVQLTYNPLPNWTFKFTGSKADAKYTSVAPEYDAWLNYRMPTWKSAAVSDIADFVDGAGTAYSLKNFWASYGYASAVKITNTDGNTSVANYYANAVDSQVGTAKQLLGVSTPDLRKYHASLLSNYNFTTGRLRGWGIGAAERYESRAIIGFYGKAGDPTKPTMMSIPDVTRPIYTKENFYTDCWVSYSTKIYHDRIGLKVQLNVDNVMENGHLEAYATNLDGTPYAFRIVDPRTFKLTTTFSF